MKVFVFVLSVLLFSCGTNDSSISGKYNFRIVEEKERNIGSGKACNIEVLLGEKLEPIELKEISLAIRESRVEYEKLWIRYFIKEVSETQGAWASASFTPEFELQLIGSLASQDLVNDSVAVEGQELGRWRSERMMGAVLILYKEKDSSLAMKIVSANGQSIVDSVWVVLQGNLETIQDGNSHGEYYVIEQGGELGLYGRNGRFDLAEKL